MATKTINLTGAEVAVTGLDGAHAHIRNDGTEVIYAAKTAGITAGADGVASIPAGQSDTIRGISGAVYLLGTGSVLIQSDDYVASPFKSSVTLGSVTGEISRAVSNSNILDNPDFKINQRGETEYTGSCMTIDRWHSSSALTVNVSDNITISAGAATGYFEQSLDRGNDFDNKLLTLSAHLSDGTVLTASGVCPQAPESGRPLFITITLPDGHDVRMYRGASAEKFSLLCQLRVYSGKSIGNLRALKLELGGIATPFCPPDQASELAKCQRYYQIRSTGDIAPVDLRPTMRDTPTVTQLSDGNYGYSAEIF